MLIFIDESFQISRTNKDKSVGVLGGIGIPEEQFHTVVNDIFQLKAKHFSPEIAKEMEIKGKELFKPYVFKLQQKGIKSKNIELGNDVLQYIVSKKLYVFGTVCFEDTLSDFSCRDVYALDKTFVYLFERIDTYLKNEYPTKMAKIIFDDRHYKINKLNSEAITNFFVRSPVGLAMSNIIKVPLFAISEAQNVGLQLSDLVAYVFGLKFSGDPRIKEQWKLLKTGLYRWEKVINSAGGKINATSLKVLRAK